MSDLRQELVEAISEAVFHGMMKYQDYDNGCKEKEVIPPEEAPAKPKAKRAAKKAKKEPEVEELEEEEAEEAEDELGEDSEAMDHETMMIAIKSLIADYAEGPDKGKELAIETLKAGYDVEKFKDLDPKDYVQVITMMTEALT